MRKIRFWIAKKLLSLAWFISPNRTAREKMNDYASIYGIGMSVVNPRDFYLDINKPLWEKHKAMMKIRNSERERAAQIVEMWMEDDEHWQPIVKDILNGKK